MDLRYIEYAGGNFRSCEFGRAAAPAGGADDSAAPEPSAHGAAARSETVAPSARPEEAAPAAALAEARVPVVAPRDAAPSNFGLVSVDAVHFDADQPVGPPMDVRALFTSNEIPGAIVVAEDLASGLARAAPAAGPAAPAPAESAPPAVAPVAPARSANAALSPAEITAQAVARLEERRAREAARHAEREAERRARKAAALAERKAREAAKEAEKNAARAAKDAARGAKRAERDDERRRRIVESAQRGAARAARPAPAPETRRTLIANAASALGLVAAVAVAAWYFAGEHGRFARETRAAAAAATAAAAPAKPAAARTGLPRAPQTALLSLAAVERQTERRVFQQVVRVQRGEYFRDLLMRGGVVGAEAQLASISLAGVYDVRKMRAGQLITIDFGILGEEHNRFLGVRFDSNFDRTVSVQRQSRGDFVATEIKKEIVTQLLRSDGTIDHSVFQAGLQAGLPPEPVVRMINLFAYDVDFQRDVQKGDTFETLIEQHRDARGDVVRHGNILFASLTLQGQTIRLYRWQGEDGEIDYFSETGHSSKKALMRTPIDGARLSSGFGFRRHPVLGYSKMHQGTDFAAPSGTPIYAAGAGQIEKIGWQGGYGNAIVIRHNKEYQTLYGHMSGFAPGMAPGKRVQQGDIIGYVGSTGMSTGPHLHYEVHFAGKPIDPLSLKLPSRQRLQGPELARYLDYVKTLNARFQALARSGATGQGLASAEPESDPGCANGVRLDPTDKRACER